MSKAGGRRRRAGVAEEVGSPGAARPDIAGVGWGDIAHILIEDPAMLQVAGPRALVDETLLTDFELPVLLLAEHGDVHAFSRLRGPLYEAGRFRYAAHFTGHPGLFEGSTARVCEARCLVKGYVEQVSAAQVEGWAVNLLSPDPLQLALRLGPWVRAIRYVDRFRSDVNSFGIVAQAHGFSFPMEGLYLDPYASVSVEAVPFGVNLPDVAHGADVPDFASRQLARVKRRNSASLVFEIGVAAEKAASRPVHASAPRVAGIACRLPADFSPALFGWAMRAEGLAVRDATISVETGAPISLRDERAAAQLLAALARHYPGAAILRRQGAAVPPDGAHVLYHLETHLGRELTLGLSVDAGAKPHVACGGLSPQALLALWCVSRPALDGTRGSGQAALDVLEVLRTTLFVNALPWAERSPDEADAACSFQDSFPFLSLVCVPEGGMVCVRVASSVIRRFEHADAARLAGLRARFLAELCVNCIAAPAPAFGGRARISNVVLLGAEDDPTMMGAGAGMMCSRKDVVLAGHGPGFRMARVFARDDAAVLGRVLPALLEGWEVLFEGGKRVLF